MIIKNCTVSTEYNYKQVDSEDPFITEEKKYVVRIEIPLPGGKATYELPSSLAINNNIEQAAKLGDSCNKGD